MSRTRLRALLEPLLVRDPGGRRWLPGLLGAAPHGERLQDRRDEPGYLHPNLTVMGIEGRRPCFMYPVAPPTALVKWFIDNPDRLTFVPDSGLSPQAELLRRALLRDEPPGVRAKAQKRAHDLVPIRSAFADEWWRFEETHEPDCLLMSDHVILILLAGDVSTPVTPWYPPRTRLHQALEAVCRLAETKRFGVVTIGAPTLDDDALRASLVEGAPHLDPFGRNELVEGYLGAVDWPLAEELLA